MMHETIKTTIQNFELSQRQLAVASGVSKSTFHRAMQGNWPKDSVLVRFLPALQRALLRSGVPANVVSDCFAGAPNLKPDEIILQGGRTVLNQNILDFFGLDKDPFFNELSSAADVYMSPNHRIVYTQMLDAAEKQKFVGVVAEVGAGKTVLKKMLTSELPERGAFVVSEPMTAEKQKCTPGIIADSILRDVIYGTGSLSRQRKLETPCGLEAKYRLLHQTLVQERKKGVRVLLVIDEAHDLGNNALKCLKRLHEMEDGFTKCLGILLLGQTELEGNLRNFDVREVSARIQLVRLRPIKTLVKEYLALKLDLAGGDLSSLFVPGAIETFATYLSASTPLEINCLAAASLQTAHNQGSTSVTPDIIELAFKDIERRVHEDF